MSNLDAAARASASQASSSLGRSACATGADDIVRLLDASRIGARVNVRLLRDHGIVEHMLVPTERVE